jgi:hypothetical protein
MNWQRIKNRSEGLFLMIGLCLQNSPETTKNNNNFKIKNYENKNFLSSRVLAAIGNKLRHAKNNYVERRKYSGVLYRQRRASACWRVPVFRRTTKN